MPRTKIYQVASLESDYAFAGLSDLTERFGKNAVKPENYCKVFDAVIDETDLEDIFKRFNTDGHPLFTGHSMSVSDIVVTEDGQAHFCDNIGFRDIGFNESLVPANPDAMNIVYKEPGRPAFRSEVIGGLEYEQRAVGGFIEPIYNDDSTVIICNEEAKFQNMKGNIRLNNGDVVAGPFFICGTTENNFCSLTEEQTEKYLKKYSEAEDIPDEETYGNPFFEIISY